MYVVVIIGVVRRFLLETEKSVKKRVVLRKHIVRYWSECCPIRLLSQRHYTVNHKPLLIDIELKPSSLRIVKICGEGEQVEEKIKE